MIFITKHVYIISRNYNIPECLRKIVTYNGTREELINDFLEFLWCKKHLYIKTTNAIAIKEAF